MASALSSDSTVPGTRVLCSNKVTTLRDTMPVDNVTPLPAVVQNKGDGDGSSLDGESGFNELQVNDAGSGFIRD